AGAKRRFPDKGEGYDRTSHSAVRNCIHLVRSRPATGRRHGTAAPHELSDENGIGLVITKVVVVGGARIVIECDEISLCIQSSPQLEREGRALRVPRSFLLPHPLDPDRTADLFGKVSRFKSGIIRSRAAIRLRTFHPDNAHAITWHLKE